MIRFSNGHSFEFMAASGALAFDGRGWPWEWPLRWTGLLDPRLFTIVTKTLTQHPRRGHLRWSHPWSVVKRISRGGIVNAIGLTNPGIEWWVQKVAPALSSGYKIIVSIEADDEKELREMIPMLEKAPILGIELNLSCPNVPLKDPRTTEKILNLCRTASEISAHPLIAKLSYTHDYNTLAKELEKTKVQAIAINSIPWGVIFPGKPSPLDRLGGGGVSGKIIQPYSWKMVREIATSSKIPVIGPSVWEYEDIQKIFDGGAQAVGFGSVFVLHPWRPTLFARRWTQEHPIRTREKP